MRVRVAPTDIPDAPDHTADVLRAFLSAYWLRPENALWMALRSQALDRCGIVGPSLDLSCGDGVFSFIHAGGRFDDGFDVFTSVAKLDRVQREHADMFDHVTDNYNPVVARRPKATIDVGTDLKPSLIAKARRLDFYGRLVEHDSNIPLPFHDDAFETAYCNSAYWMSNIDGFLSELRRVVRTSGRVVLHVKLDSMRQYTLTRHRDILGDTFLNTIGRGRIESWPTLASRSKWESRFATAGLIVEDVFGLATRTHSHLWDIGLRPLAPLLVRMANALDIETRRSIKHDWVSLLFGLLKPICTPDIDLFEGSAEPAELQYVLRPSA